MRKRLVHRALAVGLLCAVTAGIAIYVRTAFADPVTKAEPFTISQIRFDESVGPKKPTPQIPKGWKFVAVSNGEKPNSNNLWFQDAEGNIYLVRGFTDAGTFIIEQNVQSLAVAK